MSDDNLILPDSQQATRSDAVKNRALLLETAQRLFSAEGVDKVTMDAIAKAAGVGKGTLYRHFQNKTELCEALLDEDQRNLQGRALQQMRNHTNPLDNLRWFLTEALSFIDRNSALLCVESAPLGSLQHPAHWWYRQTIRGLIGQINPSGDLDYMTDLLYVMLDVHTVYFLRQVRGYSLERIADGMLTTLEKLAS